MKKLRRLLFRLFLFTIVIILGFVILNTLRFSSRQVSLPAINPIEVDKAALNRLSEAIQIPTVSYEDHIDTTAFIQLRQYIDSVFSPVNTSIDHYSVNEYSLVYRWPGKNPRLQPILLMAHLDVVPVEEKAREQWEQDPFGGKIENNFIWGRGALDDKMNALGMLEAVQLLLEKGYQPERTLFMAFGHDEEVGGKSGAQAIARRFAQQGLTFEYILDEGLVVLENALPGLEPPAALIGIAEKGYTTLNISIELEESGHSSMPPSETAIGILSKGLHHLEKNPFPADIDGPTADLLSYVGPEMDFPFKAIFANLWLFGGVLKKQLAAKPSTNATIRTTTAITIINGGIKDNVLPSKAEAMVNFRILPGETIASVVEKTKAIINDERIQVRVNDPEFSRDPSSVSSTDAFGFTVLQKTACEIFPQSVVAPALMIAATDSRHYESLSENIYRFSPIQVQHADLARIHGFNERISTDGYLQLIRFYHQLIVNSCK